MSTILDSLKVTMSSGGGGSRLYLMRDPKTRQLIEAPIDDATLTNPAAGFYQTIQLMGITAVFQMTSSYSGEEQDMVRALFRVIAPGTPNDKAVFSQLFTFGYLQDSGKRKLSTKSQIGRIFAAISGGDTAADQDLDASFYEGIIGGRFGAVVQIDKKVDRNGNPREYAKVVKETAVPAPAAEAPSQNLSQKVKNGRPANPLIDDEE
jgi:hypothetical protein